MRFIRKFKKLIKNPGLFIADSKIGSFRRNNPFDNSSNDQRKINNAPNSKLQQAALIERQPIIFGTIRLEDGLVNISLRDKKVINQSLGFSTLFVCGVKEFLVHKPFLSELLKNRDFIAFKDKSLYVLDTGYSMQNQRFSKKKINEFFLHSVGLRSNKFNMFRSLIEVNPTSIESILIKNTSSNIKFICVISNENSLNFMSAYKDFIDVLIVNKNLNYMTFNNVPRIVEFSNKKSFLDAIKIASIDCSYKKDLNLLLPIVSSQDNLSNIDFYNSQNHIHGLIRITSNISTYQTFEELIEDNETEVVDLYLRENVYSLYKDRIFNAKSDQKKIKNLLLLSLKDGVYYEAI